MVRTILRLLEAVRVMRDRRRKQMLEVLVGRETVHEDVTPSPAVQTWGWVMFCPWLGRTPFDQSPSGTQQQTLG